MVIAGAGEDEEKLKFRVSSFEFRDRVVFLGHIDHGFLPRVLKACDVFARPSRSEGLGIAFLEAMAAGLPVVATRVGGIVDFIKDGQTGVLTAPDNAGRLGEAIKKLYEDENWRRAVADAGQKLVRDNYDWQGIAGEYKKVYEII